MSLHGNQAFAWVALVLTLNVCAAAEPPTTYYVNGACGNNTWTGMSPICRAPDGPKRTIGAGIAATSDNDTVVVADGTYTGAGNTNVTFPTHTVTVRSANGRANCIIDCEGVSRAFLIPSSSSLFSELSGFTIQSGMATRGGGIFVGNNNLKIADCSFIGCEATFGGALYFENNNLFIAPITNCTFQGNRASSFGGAVYNSAAVPSFTDCTFFSNSAGLSGGGMYNESSDPDVIRCNFFDNSAVQFGGGMYNSAGSAAVVNDCQFSGNSADAGGGMYNDSSSPVLSGCGFFDNTATRFGGAMTNSNSRPTVQDCEFGQNSSGQGGGAIASSGQSGPDVKRCRFFGNISLDGGGMFNFGDKGTAVTNCEFSGNMATRFGGGIYNNASGPAINDCTFSRNTAAQGGAISNISASDAVVNNSILWGDMPDEIDDQSGSTTIVRYSDVQGGFGGVGNINVGPVFVDPAGGDFHIAGGSLVIDAGANLVVPPGVTLDLDGNPRFVDDPGSPNTGLPGNGHAEIVDMGAYEFQGELCYPDCDGSGRLDFFDFLCFQNRFVLGESYACDCDLSPVCSFFDFLCFQNEFVQGCP